MKNRTDVRTLALMARVARVHEIRSKQALAATIRHKDVQETQTLAAQARADHSDRALRGLLEGETVDLARLPMWQDLSTHVHAALADERNLLSECVQQVSEQSRTAGKQARQRELLEERTEATKCGLRLSREKHQLELATEAWLTRRHTETP
jgi:hypothetical protein